MLGIAGKVCAHILISGVHFISLESSSSDTEASFDELKFGHIDEIKAVLSTKTFSMVSVRFFMPKHRALAEFLGAYWLKMQLNQKLTLTRFLNIIGYDNFPATELRGLFAWLSTSNLFAQHLIHLDPLGALLYGDVERLSEANKLKLIQAMNSVAESDPFFNPNQSNDDLLVHLSTPHNTRLFQTILEDSKATIGMRRFTLRVMEQGPKLPHLEKLLVSHLNQGVPYVLRYQAINTIFNSLPNGPSLLIEHFRSGFNSEDEEAKYLKVLIINNAYEYGLHAEDVVEALLNFLVEGREIYGSLWKFGQNIPSEDLPLILDLLPSNILPLIEKENVEISTEILGLIDFFIYRCIEDKTVENEQLYRWLSDYYQYKRHCNFSKKEGVYSLLKTDKELVWALFQIHMAKNLSSPRLEWNKFRLILLDALDHDYFIRNLYELCLKQHYSDTTNDHLFEITLLLTINLGGERHVNIFDHLMDISNSSNDLKTTAQNLSFCELETWRNRENERVKRQLEERRKAKEKNITQFDEDYKTVLKSDKTDWLIFSARLYLAAGYSSVNDLPHRERLQTFVGNTRANILMNWLADYVRNGTAVKLEDAVENYRRNTYLAESYIILAGLDIYWERFGNVNGIPTKLLEVAIVLNLQITTFSRLTGPTIPDSYKWVENLREQKPVLFERPYLELAKVDIYKKEWIGLNAFVKYVHSNPSCQKHVISFLVDPKVKNYAILLKLFRTLTLTENVKNELVEFAEQLLSNGAKPRGIVLQFWVVILFSLRPTKGWVHFENYFSKNTKIIWVLIDAFNSHDFDANLLASVDTLQMLISVLAKKFVHVNFPNDEYVGSQNPWDATQFIKKLISALSSQGSSAATKALQDLLDDKHLASYHSLIKHSLYKQIEVYRQANYVRPKLGNTINSLSNQNPSSLSELQVVLVEILDDIQKMITNSNTDTYKAFWNEDSNGKLDTPKNEESCRDRLLDLLRPKLNSFELIAEPESHMAKDKRADIVVHMENRLKLPIEIKRDSHKDLWRAPTEQLVKLYSSDESSQGYGIYLVFWFSDNRLVGPPRPAKKPSTPQELEENLQKLVDETKIKVYVMNVSEDYL